MKKVLVAFSAMLALVCDTALSQAYPNRPIRMVVGFAPGGTPPAIVNRLHAETMKAMQSPEVRPKLADAGADGTVTRTPQEFTAIVRADVTRYAKIIKEAGLKID